MHAIRQTRSPLTRRHPTAAPHGARDGVVRSRDGATLDGDTPLAMHDIAPSADRDVQRRRAWTAGAIDQCGFARRHRDQIGAGAGCAAGIWRKG